MMNGYGRENIFVRASVMCSTQVLTIIIFPVTIQARKRDAVCAPDTPTHAVCTVHSGEEKAPDLVEDYGR